MASIKVSAAMFVVTASVIPLSGIPAEPGMVMPVHGTWKVHLGPPCPANGHHCSTPSQQFAYDLMAVDPGGTPVPCYGRPVHSPTAGVVVQAVDGFPNAPHGFPIPGHHIAGNHVVIRRSPGEYVLLAHLSPGTLTVSTGAHVQPGTPVGQCGNSGNSTYPHLHMHMQATWDPLELHSPGLPMTFAAVRVWMGPAAGCQTFTNHHLMANAYLC